MTRVLLVEDSFILALDLEAQLRDLGVDVVGPFADAASARRALAAPGAAPPTHALLDVQLRGGTSLDLAAELTAAGVRCVFITGYGDIPDLPPALAAVPRLTKPLAADALLRALDVRLG